MVKANKQPELHNEKLEEEMKTFAGEQSKEQMLKILQGLSGAIIMQPALFPPGTDPMELKKIAEGGVSNSKIRPRPVILKNKDGNNFYPVFTSKEQIPDGQKYPALLFLPFMECVKLAKKSEANLKGIVVNPFTTNLVIHPAALDMLHTKSNTKKVTLTGAQMQALLRNQFEMMELPQKFYADKTSFMNIIFEKKEDFLVELYQESYSKVKGLEKACPYQAKDFEMMFLNISDSVQMVQLMMPEKNRMEGQCVSVFLFHNPETEDAIYYTIKKGEKGQANKLGSVDCQGKFTSLGDAPQEGAELYSLLNTIPWSK